MNTAKVIPFRKPQEKIQEAGSNMYSNKFEQGYVMSSRLYRKEVWPFLSDAARNVYAELENRINGHNKESDFVSYSQLQGGELEGSRQLGRKTVSAGIKELVELGVISVIESGKQGVKKYRLNDISLKDRFTRETSSPTTLVHLQHRDRFTRETETSSPSELTIDNKNSLEEEEEGAQENKKIIPQNRQLNFIEYHVSDRTAISLKNLFQKYPAQVDFYDQAKISFPDHSHEQIVTELRKLAQWSLSAGNHMPQKWMNIWLNWMQKIPTQSELAAAEARKQQKSQSQTQTPKAEKPKRVSRFGKYLKPQQSQQGEIYDV